MEHHHLAGTIRLMNDAEYERTKADIAANGLRNPILIYEGKILDGRHRERACRELGVTPVFETFEGDHAAALREVRTLNVARRHLSDAEIDSLAADAATATRADASAKGKIAQGKSVKAKIRFDTKPMTNAEAAEAYGTTEQRVKYEKAKRKAAAPKMSKAFFAKEPGTSKKIAEAVIDAKLTDAQAQEQFGVSSTVVRIAVAHEVGQREARADPIIDPTTLSMSAQAKLAAAIRQHQKKLDDSFYAAVGVRVEQVVRDVWLPQHQKMVDDAKLVLKGRRSIMTKKQHQMIRMCLHPDNAASVEKRAEAFRVFEAIPAVQLFDEAEEARLANVTPLPKTYAEMVAGAWRVKAERAAKRTAAKAGRS